MESNFSLAETIELVEEQDPKKGEGSKDFEELNLALKKTEKELVQ